MTAEPMTLAGVLPKTRWSLVIRAGTESDDPAIRSESRKSLEQLCEIYWPALYGYLRRRGYQRADSEDLIQGFFADLLSRNSIGSASEARGRFRAFLFSSLDHFVANRHRAQNAVKRGGGKLQFTLNPDTMRNWDSRLQRTEPAVPNGDPAKCFDRQWATCLLEHVMRQLEAEYVEKGKSDWFAELSVFLTHEIPTQTNRKDMAARLSMTATALKVAIHRLRADYRRLLVHELADTTDGHGESGREREWLFQSFEQ
ncbi:MAG: sigma-70 family RNA polymerase sigma factor [Planctomycetota bacterium]